MARNADGDRRVSIEQRRIFRSAKLEFVEIGRVAGMEPAASELMREWDITGQGLLQFGDWSDDGLHALMLVRIPVLVGCVEGAGPLHWLANAEVLLAAQSHWPKHTRIPAVVLAHQITPRTRIQAAGAGLFASCAPPLAKQLPPETIFRLWQRLIQAKLNPLSSDNKMALVRALGCDPRRLPAARPIEQTPNSAT